MMFCNLHTDCHWFAGLPTWLLFRGFFLCLILGLLWAVFDCTFLQARRRKKEEELIKDIKLYGIKHK